MVAITPAAGALLIGGYIGMDGHATITAHSIFIAEALNLGTLTTELVLLSNGSVTQGAGDSLLNLGILDGSAEHFALLGGGNVDLGTLYDLIADYNVVRNLTLSFFLGYVQGGDVEAATFSSRDADYAYLQLLYRF